jgi:hypothetical protein
VCLRLAFVRMPNRTGGSTTSSSAMLRLGRKLARWFDCGYETSVKGLQPNQMSKPVRRRIVEWMFELMNYGNKYPKSSNRETILLGMFRKLFGGRVLI